MGDRNITLFALHTHGDTQFGPSAIPGVEADEEGESAVPSKAKSWFGSDSEESDAAETDVDVSPVDQEESGGNVGTLLVALVVLAGIAMAARKLTGGEETEVDVTESDDL